MTKPSLLFVSPQFLFPMDAGGKIRSVNILKHLKGGAFATRLLMPAAPDQAKRWKGDINALADETTLWLPGARGTLWKARRAAGFFAATPISALSDADAAAKAAVAGALALKPDLVVFDYAQSFAMAPATIGAPSLFFAHNVETEILARHAAVATGPMKIVWSREAAKMRRFERRACETLDAVVAVSERDADMFRKDFGAKSAYAIPTGVDPDYFFFAPADGAGARVVFTGSMDWKANQDGLSWFMNEVWPLIAERRPDASFTVVGKNPPRAMIEAAAAKGFNWRFTGFVDDVRAHARGQAYVVPLRVGGGTRIKVYEAMAMGVPVVSTRLGVEGLPLSPGAHFLEAETPRAFADAVLSLLADAELRGRLAAAARRLVEENFSHLAAARVFERHCLAVLDGAR